MNFPVDRGRREKQKPRRRPPPPPLRCHLTSSLRFAPHKNRQQALHT